MRVLPGAIWSWWLQGRSVLAIAAELNWTVAQVEEALRHVALELGRSSLEVANTLIAGYSRRGDRAAGEGHPGAGGQLEAAHGKAGADPVGDAEGAAPGLAPAGLVGGDGVDARRRRQHPAAEDGAQE